MRGRDQPQAGGGGAVAIGGAMCEFLSSQSGRESGVSLQDKMLAALAVPPERLGAGSPVGLEVVADSAAMLRHFADSMLAEYRAALAARRERAVFIVPVGPVGQYDLLAERCNAERISLSRLVLLNMDEYLAEDGGFIDADDRLSFRGHMARHFFGKLDPALAPPRDAVVFPDPRDPANVQREIDRLGGVDVAYGGVGVTGHLAFNDPPEPDAPDDVVAFAALPSRVVTLSRESLVINAVNGARGNFVMMPKRAVTVGMREILGARKVRVYMHRPYGATMLRLLLHGPVTARVPASLLQRHADAAAIVTAEVTPLPEPPAG
jgi:glucosamine-6-phosphate deaminase